MPNPLPNRWYWHRIHDCPVYVQRIKPNGLVHYFVLILNGSEWPYCSCGDSFPCEFDPWPLKGLCSERMSRNKITGEPEPIYCAFCGEYIPQGRAVDILGRDVCLECEYNHTTCGNCGASRIIENDYVLECANCGDDEYEIATVEDQQIP